MKACWNSEVQCPCGIFKKAKPEAFLSRGAVCRSSSWQFHRILGKSQPQIRLAPLPQKPTEADSCSMETSASVYFADSSLLKHGIFLTRKYRFPVLVLELISKRLAFD